MPTPFRGSSVDQRWIWAEGMPTPASTNPRSYQADTGSVALSDAASSGRSSGKSLVEDAFYRSRNLAVNGIFMRQIDEEFPTDIASLVPVVGKDRGSPGPPRLKCGMMRICISWRWGLKNLMWKSIFVPIFTLIPRRRRA